MDLATIIGIIGGISLIIGAIFMGGTLMAFINLPSVLIVFGGVMAATLINYPISKLIDVMKILKVVFTEKRIDAEDIIKNIVSLAETARREGLLALEDAAYHLKDEFLQKGILLIVDGTDPELVRNILETELAFVEERHKEGQSIFETMGSLSPSFGLLGTIIGLINMLNQLTDPSAIGAGMATALITTFYGAILGYLVFVPIAGKLKVRSHEEILMREVMIEGMLSIQAGENPRIIEEKLNAFLSPKKRITTRMGKVQEGGDSFAWQQTAK